MSLEINNIKSKSVGPNHEDWLNSKLVEDKLKNDYIETGLVVFPNIFNTEQIQNYNNIIKSNWETVDDGKNEAGHGDRIGQLHQKFPELLELASNQKILNFLKWAFDDDPIVFGSLNFERGSQQEAHIDSIFFWPEPHFSMAGCWIALEDVQKDSGPLFYLPGSHKWPFYHSENIISAKPELSKDRTIARNGSNEKKAEMTSILGNAWTQLFGTIENKKK